MDINNSNDLTLEENQVIHETQKLLGAKTFINTGNAIAPLLQGFRGKKGKAIAAVYPTSLTDMYLLIQLYRKLGVGYVLQGANTALKGQGTPNNDGKLVVIIKTLKLKKMKILDFPGNNDYKILLTEPGLSLKEAELILDKLQFDLPHKIGSHDLGNTFGASTANGCGGVRVDNRDGRASMTQAGNMGVIAINAEGIIYNGFIRSDNIKSGEALLSRIDANQIKMEDLDFPQANEISEFLKLLFCEKSYPIKNHRGEIIFSGDGGEGSQAIVYQMYLIRKKPEKVNTFTLLFANKDLKEKFYRDVVFSEGPDKPDSLPILCESMSANLVDEIVNKGVGYFSAVFLAVAPLCVTKYVNKFLAFRNHLIHYAPSTYVAVESFMGKCLSAIFTPEIIKKVVFSELVVLQSADRPGSLGNIAHFTQKLDAFVVANSSDIQVLKISPGSFLEKMILQIRTTAALATLTLSVREKGVLFAFDDAIMPGDMTHQYCQLLFKRLALMHPGVVLEPYLYGHDLKQISHNDWILKGEFTPAELHAIHHVQLEVMLEIGGIAHAEHGVGDYAGTDLNRHELVKLVAHRLLNDVNGIANPGGGPEKAFQKACNDGGIVSDAIALAKKAVVNEQERGTLYSWAGIGGAEMTEILNRNIALLFPT